MPDELTDTEHVAGSSRQTSHADGLNRLPNLKWVPVLQQPCDFGPDVFESVSLNLLKNPNINSSLLFRADILFDSKDELTDETISEDVRQQALLAYSVHDGELPGFTVERTILRKMIPRNPQLDKSILQTCLLLNSSEPSGVQQSLVIYIPHTSSVDEMPWYHPRVQSLAYLHTWPSSSQTESSGSVSLHYRLFPSEGFPLSSRLERTAQHLLSTIIKHGHGRMVGYEKRVQHDQVVSQQRVQNAYTELKRRHAQRLCDKWVEKTEPSKHVFEDLGIAAFLIELWRDVYGTPVASKNDKQVSTQQNKPPFPGFVDIGCGNGVLVDVLIREGYQGWGFDARKRKTWDTFDPSIRKYLKELILLPEPLLCTTSCHSQSRKWSLSNLKSSIAPSSPASHNGIFPTGTFIISNHADELTPWTPLLASISMSPFLCIPCCSHNLSGSRFRAPSVFNNNTADAFAPSYFANYVSKAKAVPIVVAQSDNDEMHAPPPDDEEKDGMEKGDLKNMAAQRKKQPSAYSSLCDWVGNLAATVGYEVEKEMLRLPSTRNVGLVGRRWRERFEDESQEVRKARVTQIVREEKADGDAWNERARGLTKGQGGEH